MIIEAANSAADPVPWTSILGVGGTILGAVVGGIFGWLIAKTQAKEETRRQATRMKAEQEIADATWLREQRVSGYLSYLTLIDRSRLYVQMTRGKVENHGVPPTNTTDVQSALTIVAMYGPDQLRDKAYLLMNALSALDKTEDQATDLAFVAAKNAYVTEARKHLGVL
jgi:hypothetical protein